MDHIELSVAAIVLGATREQERRMCRVIGARLTWDGDVDEPRIERGALNRLYDMLHSEFQPPEVA